MAALRSLAKAANRKAQIRESIRAEVDELQFHLDKLAEELENCKRNSHVGKRVIRRSGPAR